MLTLAPTTTARFALRVSPSLAGTPRVQALAALLAFATTADAERVPWLALPDAPIHVAVHAAHALAPDGRPLVTTRAARTPGAVRGLFAWCEPPEGLTDAAHAAHATHGIATREAAPLLPGWTAPVCDRYLVVLADGGRLASGAHWCDGLLGAACAALWELVAFHAAFDAPPGVVARAAAAARPGVGPYDDGGEWHPMVRWQAELDEAAECVAADVAHFAAAFAAQHPVLLADPALRAAGWAPARRLTRAA